MTIDNETPRQTDDLPESSEEPGVDAVVNADELFGGKKVLWIEHAGVRYKLRITRRNRLILQK